MKEKKIDLIEEELIQEDEFEIDFLAIGDSYVDTLCWRKLSHEYRVFETYHPELKGEEIKIREHSSEKKYQINIENTSYEISNYRVVDFPYDLHQGPALLALTLRNLEGKDSGPSLLLEYGSDGKLLEGIFPPEKIYFIEEDILAPCVIFKDNKIFTLPINFVQYERIQALKDYNEGVSKKLATESDLINYVLNFD